MTKLRSLISVCRPSAVAITHIVSVVLLCGVAVVPLLRGASPCTHDGGLHYYRVVAVRDAMDQGLLFTRWLPSLAFGYGIPFFNYYAPGSYYLVLGLHLTGASLPLALNLIQALSILGSALGAYLWSKDLFGPRAGVVAAVAYAYAPYLLLNALVRGSLPESVALAFLPFIFWAFRRLVVVGSRNWFLVSVALLAGLYLSHNISSLLFTPLLLAYVVMLRRVYPRRGGWTRVALSICLALGLTAFFWFPALAEKEYVQIYLTSATRNNDFHYNFLSLREIFAPPQTVDTSLINPPLRIKLGLVQALVAGAGVIVGLVFSSGPSGRAVEGQDDTNGKLVQNRKPKERRTTLLFSLASALLFVFMSTPASTWIWELLPLLPFVQFPWRFVGPSSLLIALLAGAAVVAIAENATNSNYTAERLRKRCLHLLPPALVGIIVLVTLPATYPTAGYCSMTPYPTVSDLHRYEHESQLVGVDAEGAYFPIGVQERPQGSPLEAQYGSDGQVTRFDASVFPADARILEADYGPNRARIVVESPTPFQARYLSFHFPGWKASVDGERVKIAPSDPEGLITFDVPPGRHELFVRFGETPLRRVVDIVSALCLVVLLFYWSWPIFRKVAKSSRLLAIFGDSR